MTDNSDNILENKITMENVKEKPISEMELVEGDELDHEDFSHLTEEQLDIESEKCFEEGKKQYKEKKFEDAMNTFQRGLKMRVINHGELGLVCAKFYLWCGKSLHNISKAETDMFGNDVSDKKESKDTTSEQKKPTVSTENKEEPSVSTEKKEEVEKDKETKSNTEDEKQDKITENNDKPSPKSETELVDDRQLAWENMEIARVIWSKSNEKEHKYQLASAIGFCGEICLENDNYKQAKEEFYKAAKLHEELEGKHSRKAAGDYVSAAVGAIYSDESNVGYELYLEAITHLDNLIRKLIGKEHEENMEDVSVAESEDKQKTEESIETETTQETTETETTTEQQTEINEEKKEPMETEIDEEEDDLILLAAEVINDWLENNKTHENYAEVKELAGMVEEISERLDGIQEEVPRDPQAEVAEIMAKILQEQMAKQATENDDELKDKNVNTEEKINDLTMSVKNKSNVEPINDLTLNVKRKNMNNKDELLDKNTTLSTEEPLLDKLPSNKRPLTESENPIAKKQKTTL